MPVQHGDLNLVAPGDQRHFDFLLRLVRLFVRQRQPGRAVHRHVVYVDVEPVERELLVVRAHAQAQGCVLGGQRHVVGEDLGLRQPKIRAQHGFGEAHLLQPTLIRVAIALDQLRGRGAQTLEHDVRPIEAQVELLERIELIVRPERDALDAALRGAVVLVRRDGDEVRSSKRDERNRFLASGEVPDANRTVAPTTYQ